MSDTPRTDALRVALDYETCDVPAACNCGVCRALTLAATLEGEFRAAHVYGDELKAQLDEARKALEDVLAGKPVRNADEIIASGSARVVDFQDVLKDARSVLRIADRSDAWKVERDRVVAAIEAALARPEHVQLLGVDMGKPGGDQSCKIYGHIEGGQIVIDRYELDDAPKMDVQRNGATTPEMGNAGANTMAELGIPPQFISFANASRIYMAMVRAAADGAPEVARREGPLQPGDRVLWLYDASRRLTGKHGTVSDTPHGSGDPEWLCVDVDGEFNDGSQDGVWGAKRSWLQRISDSASNVARPPNDRS